VCVSVDGFIGKLNDRRLFEVIEAKQKRENN
jgi:hypothetical protein